MALKRADMFRRFREACLRALEPAPRVREQDTENEDRQEGDRFEHQSPFAPLYLSGEPERPAMQGNAQPLPLRACDRAIHRADDDDAIEAQSSN
ncbi:hypothetical protein GGR90_000294 [Sphingopyxis italica]|uniref:Uncharacterized protein n=1 Tax=Sphingopyxis italica TaxID=1129133 RepID=A0A7X6B7W5_9SPHN|nr:hypothetical protein [Sphingopyxis italica]